MDDIDQSKQIEQDLRRINICIETIEWRLDYESVLIDGNGKYSYLPKATGPSIIVTVSSKGTSRTLQISSQTVLHNNTGYPITLNFDLYSKSDQIGRNKASFFRASIKKPVSEVKTELAETIMQTLPKHGVYHVPLELYCQSVKLDISIIKKQQGRMDLDEDL